MLWEKSSIQVSTLELSAGDSSVSDSSGAGSDSSGADSGFSGAGSGSSGAGSLERTSSLQSTLDSWQRRG